MGKRTPLIPTPHWPSIGAHCSPNFRQVFIIETTDGRVYYLSAASKDLMDNWVDRLHRVFLRELMANARGGEDGALEPLRAVAE